MVFGFKNKDNASSNTLTEGEIRKRLYGGAVNVVPDPNEKPASPFKKKDRTDEARGASPDKLLREERIKIVDELRSLRKELEQTKKKLKRMRGVKIKKVRLLIIFLAIFILLASCATLIVRQFLRTNEKLTEQGKTVSTMRYVIQAATYAESSSAEKFTLDLQTKGYMPFIKKMRYGSGKEKFVVFVGSFNDKGSASSALSKLKKEEKLRGIFITKISTQD